MNGEQYNSEALRHFRSRSQRENVWGKVSGRYDRMTSAPSFGSEAEVTMTRSYNIGQNQAEYNRSRKMLHHMARGELIRQ